MTDRLVALTGGTGFVGRHAVSAFARAGWRLRLLVRRDPIGLLPTDVVPELVLGSLSDRPALDRLVAGADAVVHLAGLTKALDRAGFMAGNRDGTAGLVAAVAAHAPRARRLLVSSLAAREPQLSHYAASKRAAEAVAPDWTILRPAVVYGPGDLEGLALKRLAEAPLMPRPRGPEPRLAMLHATDLAEALVAFAGRDAPSGIFEVCDARPEGYGLTALAARAAALLGRRPPPALPLPDAVLLAVGLGGDALARLTRRPRIAGIGKMRELLHRDWSCAPARLPPASLWAPRIDLEQGLADTVGWWRRRTG